MQGDQAAARERTEQRFLSADELERLAAAVAPRHCALILTAGYLGLRWGEVAGLKRKRLNLLRGTLEVAEILVELNGRLSFGEPKSASRRTLTMPPFLVAELETHLHDHSTHGEHVFASTRGAPLRRVDFRRRAWLPAVRGASRCASTIRDTRPWGC